MFPPSPALHNPLTFFCSWSGGKDSCLALHRMRQAGHNCTSLFTMTDENGKHSRSHGLTTNTLCLQAEALGLPIRIGSASWDRYETEFHKQAARFRQEDVTHGVFGDIDLEEHRAWVERVCSESGITAHEPLWKGLRRKLLQEFIDAGFKAVVVVVNTNQMPERFLGRAIDADLANELEALDIDACGENGEYHSFVYDGPLFAQKLVINKHQTLRKNQYTFLSLEVSAMELS